MTLFDLCEPLFQYVCKLSRMAKAALGSDYAVVRSDIKTIINQMHEKAGSDPKLSAQVKKIELPLIFFVDSMISESSLKFASQWQKEPLAFEKNELAGDEKFFDLLEETLNDASEEATERLAIFHICMGLGFTGIYANQPEQLRRMMNQVFPRIRHLVETDETAKICREAYENVDTRDLVQPPSSKIGWILVVFVFCTLSVMAGCYWMFRDASEDLRISLEKIAEHDQPRTR